MPVVTNNAKGELVTGKSAQKPAPKPAPKPDPKPTAKSERE